MKNKIYQRHLTCQESNVQGCVVFTIGWTNLVLGSVWLISLTLVANVIGQDSPSRFVTRISLVTTLCSLYKSYRNPWCQCHAITKQVGCSFQNPYVQISQGRPIQALKQFGNEWIRKLPYQKDLIRQYRFQYFFTIRIWALIPKVPTRVSKYTD